ncbi:MAG: ABC transporter substrate-binding protein [Burkholderiales bacterium]|nr:ABC transporter substrate-binding protein [Burkholderiales bacterium]
MRPQRFVVLITACAAVLLSGAASAQEKVKMRIGTHIAISAHLFMQKKPEVLKNLGKTYDIEWVRFSGSGDAMPALVAGKLDGTLGTPFPLANALYVSQVPVTIVHQLLSFGFDGHYDDPTVVRGDSGINKIADLKGKIFGVNAIGGTLEQGLRIIARKHGLDPDRDLTIVEGRPPFLPAMVRDGKVHAATLFQPFFQQAMEKGGLKILYTASDIYGGPTDYVFMVFEQKFLKANPGAVRGYIEDYLRAVNWALDNRAEAVRIYAEQWKLPLPVVDSYLLTKKDYLVRRDGRLSAKGIQPVLDALAANKFIVRSFDVATHIDLSYLPK